MDPSDIALYAAVGAISLAFVLWALTNWHVLRVGRGIKADIDRKRLETEAFVADQIGRIERSVADLRGAPPPPVMGEMQEEVGTLRRELTDALAQMGVDMGKVFQLVEGLPRHFQILMAQAQGVEKRAFQESLTALDAEVGAKMNLQEALAANDPRMVQLAAMKKIAEMKPTDKWTEEHPYGAMFFEMMKSKALEVGESFGFGTSFSGGGTAHSTVRRRGPSGERMDLKL